MLLTKDERILLETTMVDHIFECESNQKELIADLETEIGDDEQDAETIREDIRLYQVRLDALGTLLSRFLDKSNTEGVWLSTLQARTVLYNLQRLTTVDGDVLAIEEVLKQQLDIITNS